MTNYFGRTGTIVKKKNSLADRSSQRTPKNDNGSYIQDSLKTDQSMEQHEN